jgi:chromosome segregation ATPase
MSSPADVLKAATSLFAFATDNDPEDEPSKIQVADSLKAATAVMNLGEDVNTNTNVTDALLAATGVMALGSLDTEPAVTAVAVANNENWTKNAIIKLKTNSDTDKNELQRLNKQLREYLDNVRILEQLNNNLMKEVDKAKQSYAPKLFDRGQFDPELNKLRVHLETESNECVKFKARIEESESLCQHLGQRIKFYQGDIQAHRQKISALENQLNDINGQRDYLIRFVFYFISLKK